MLLCCIWMARKANQQRGKSLASLWALVSGLTLMYKLFNQPIMWIQIAVLIIQRLSYHKLMEKISMLTADSVSSVFNPRFQTQCLDLWWTVNNTLAYRVLCFVYWLLCKTSKCSSSTNILVSIYISQTADKTKKTKQRVALNLENHFNYFLSVELCKQLYCTPCDILGSGSHTAKICISTLILNLLYFELIAWATLFICVGIICNRIIPVLRMMNGEDDPRVEVILFEGHQHGELILASQFLDHLLWHFSRSHHFPGGPWNEDRNIKHYSNGSIVNGCIYIALLSKALFLPLI